MLRNRTIMIFFNIKTKQYQLEENLFKEVEQIRVCMIIEILQNLKSILRDNKIKLEDLRKDLKLQLKEELMKKEVLIINPNRMEDIIYNKIPILIKKVELSNNSFMIFNLLWIIKEECLILMMRGEM